MTDIIKWTTTTAMNILCKLLKEEMARPRWETILDLLQWKNDLLVENS